VARSARSNPQALAVLACLYERPMHPYEVAQTLRSRAKHESIRLNYGSLYGVVDTLEKRGFVQAVETVRAGRRPERTVYEITDAGVRELHDWLSEMLATPVKEYLQFEAGLSLLAVLPPDVATVVLHERALGLEVTLAQMRGAHAATQAVGLPRLFELEGEYQMALLEAELDFVKKLVKDIESGELEGLDMWQAWFEDGTPITWHPPED
jgi:DNA-binding PadR family transcriptional regulator